MAGQGRPFLFCRYSITVANETLNQTGQFTILSELQGHPVAHGERAEEEGNYNTLLMRPKQLTVARREVFAWSVGVMIRQRLRAKYDEARDRIDLELIDDGSVRYSDFVAVPSLSVLAVDAYRGR